jgi:hypothetical protein
MEVLAVTEQNPIPGEWLLITIAAVITCKATDELSF